MISKTQALKKYSFEKFCNKIDVILYCFFSKQDVNISKRPDDSGRFSTEAIKHDLDRLKYGLNPIKEESMRYKKIGCFCFIFPPSKSDDNLQIIKNDIYTLIDIKKIITENSGCFFYDYYINLDPERLGLQVSIHEGFPVKNNWYNILMKSVKFFWNKMMSVFYHCVFAVKKQIVFLKTCKSCKKE